MLLYSITQLRNIPLLITVSLIAILFILSIAWTILLRW